MDMLTGSGIIRDFTKPRSSKSRAPRPHKKRGPKSQPSRIPCDDCILQASQHTNAELCSNCQAITIPRRARKKSHVPEPMVISSWPNTIATCSDDKREQQAFAFFIRHSSPQLAGFFDSTFWQSMIPLAANSYPALMHIVSAIGALHEHVLRSDDQGVSMYRFAVEQCNKSIALLQNLTSNSDIRLILAASTLFTCFEALQGNSSTAVTHATHGQALYHAHKNHFFVERGKAAAFPIGDDDLHTILIRLATQSKGLLGKDFKSVQLLGPDDSDTQRQFCSLSDARTDLESLLNRMMIFVMDIDEQTYPELEKANQDKQDQFEDWTRSWKARFDAFLARPQTTFNTQQKRAAKVLRAHHICAEILCDLDLTLGELGWDACRHHFLTIVNLAEEVLLDGNAVNTSGSSDREFLCFSMGIVEPLFRTVRRCRDPLLRRRALDLLDKSPIHDGLFDSRSLRTIAREIIAAEESNLSVLSLELSNIDLQSRISEAWSDSCPMDSRISVPQEHDRIVYKRALPKQAPGFRLHPDLLKNDLYDKLACAPIFCV